MGETVTRAHYEFIGKLTLSEKRYLRAWQIRRRAIRFYVFWLCGWLSVAVVGLAISHRDPVSALEALFSPFVLFNLVFIAYFLVRLLMAVATDGRKAPGGEGDTTVRFFDNKIEMVSWEGNIVQFPPRLIRVLRTRRGITCVTVRGGVPMFFLPNRVLTPEQIRDLPRLYAAPATR